MFNGTYFYNKVDAMFRRTYDKKGLKPGDEEILKRLNNISGPMPAPKIDYFASRVYNPSPDTVQVMMQPKL